MRHLAAVAALVVLASCSGWRPVSVAFAVVPPLSPTALRYRVASSRGEWTRDVVVSRDGFAELRTVAGRSYALGLIGAGAWLQAGARRPVAIDGDLAADLRTEAAWLGARFAEPEAGSRTELESCHAGVCTVVYTPRDGHALWVDVDRETRRPQALAWIAQHDAVESCQGLAWSEVDGAMVIASATCSAIVDEVGRDTMVWTLEERSVAGEVPAWARVSADDVLPIEPQREAATFAIADPSQRVYAAVDAGGSASLNLVVDTGSPVTVLSRRALDAAGVVPSPEPPLHVRPPFLPPDTYDTALVDRLVMGGVALHGVRVLIPRHGAPFDGDEAGLLGMDVLSRFVVDVDSPARALRLWPRDRSPARGEAFTGVPLWGASHGRVVVAGEVDEIGPMPMLVDTGAPLGILVGGPAMHARHPHHPGDPTLLHEDGDASDYEAEIRGMHLGPFALPRMPALGHDRRPDLSFLDGDMALVGMGVLRHFRMVVDAAGGRVHLSPGPSYVALVRLGVEIDDRGGRPTITRLVEGEHDWKRPLREGDVVRSVDGRPVRDADGALRAIAAAGARVRLGLERRGNRLTRVVALQ